MAFQQEEAALEMTKVRLENLVVPKESREHFLCRRKCPGILTGTKEGVRALLGSVGLQTGLSGSITFPAN